MNGVAATAAADLGATLAVLREHALALTAAGAACVRVEASGIIVELHWPSVAAHPRLEGLSGSALEPVRTVPAPTSVIGSNGTAPAEAVPAPPPTRTVTAPTVGTFYTASEPGVPPFVAVGDVVGAGAQVGIVEAMKLMIPVMSDRGGRVVAVLAGDGQPVEFGQPLLELADA